MQNRIGIVQIHEVSGSDVIDIMFDGVTDRIMGLAYCRRNLGLNSWLMPLSLLPIPVVTIFSCTDADGRNG